MSPAKTKLTQKEDIHAFLKSSLSEDPPFAFAFYEEAVEIAVTQYKSNMQYILSTLHWIESNQYFPTPSNRKKLQGFTPIHLANLILNPKDFCLEYLQEKSPLSMASLRKVYNKLMHIGEPNRMPDFTPSRVLQEMKWWIVDIHLPFYYFQTSQPEEIAHQIRMNRATNIHSIGNVKNPVNIKVEQKSGNLIYWVDHRREQEVEEELENNFSFNDQQLLNISCYTIITTSNFKMKLYIVDKSDDTEDSERFEECAPRYIASEAPTSVKGRYKKLWEKSIQSRDLLVEESQKNESKEHRLVISFPDYFFKQFLTKVSQVLSIHHLELNRRYTVTFGGRSRVMMTTLYSVKPFPKEIVQDLVSLSLNPENNISPMVKDFVFSPQEGNFINACAMFIQQFINVNDVNLKMLEEKFKTDIEFTSIIRDLQKRLDNENYMLSSIIDFFGRHSSLVHLLYHYFELQFNPLIKNTDKPLHKVKAQLETFMQEHLSVEKEKNICRWTFRFIQSIQRTNFFMPSKTTLVFRFKQNFLEGLGFPKAPHGVFMLLSTSFKGFHVRFKDIARGGIRIIRSHTQDQFIRNQNHLFQECYNLAFTQNKKNKDIPEGGSKGVILITGDQSDDNADSSFQRYVNGLLDMMMPGNKKHIKGFEQEILFLGPDEGTAHLMDWASLRARKREYPYWKGFTTGKTAKIGGVSHIDYGMTTTSVHQYVLDLLKALGLKETEITKAQTGGPDGDLGSNEILISKDKTVTIIDGSGVLFDPTGLDRVELKRLAKKRLSCSNFDREKISKKGFLVLISDKNIKLPDGTLVPSGEQFRNQFHLHPLLRADLFVPCGGRPNSISLSNWKELFDSQGNPRFKYIVEGANLFITPEARIKLEEAGIIIFKDASTNKGGVTSSSLEVLPGLGLTDKDFFNHMTSDNQKLPEFRKTYIKEILQIIRKKASLEFKLLWKNRKIDTITNLSDKLSNKINEITELVLDSDIVESQDIQKTCLSKHVPAILAKKFGIQSLINNIPASYLSAITARTIASSLVYAYGMNPSYEDYRNFILQLKKSK